MVTRLVCHSLSSPLAGGNRLAVGDELDAWYMGSELQAADEQNLL